MSRTRKQRGRVCPRVERLESRRLFATTAGTLSVASSLGDHRPRIVAATTGAGQEGGPMVVATDPADGAILGASPRTITLTFDRPIDPDSLGDDLLLLRVGDDGVSAPALRGGAKPVSSLDATGTRLSLELPEALAPDHYRVQLWQSSSLYGEDGKAVKPEIAGRSSIDFQVRRTGVRLADAIDLGTAGSVPTARRGVLNLRKDPSAVQLYKVTLPAGPDRWRLGLEVRSSRDGSKLRTGLSLFDARGAVIETARLGRSDFPNDPYLFAALPAGTYYVGISDPDNLPDLPGGYDPIDGTIGSAARPQDGGGYALRMVADPISRTTSLVGMTLDDADPRDATPTGITLGFDGPLGIRPGRSGGRGLEVVGPAGRTWPVAMTGYDEANLRVSFLFEDALPQGHYTVRLPAGNGLVDLAGLPPTAPGRPAGVLGGFDVGPALADRSPNDIGALLPKDALAGITRKVRLGPGETTSYRVVVVAPGSYRFGLDTEAGALAVRMVGPDGEVPIDTSPRAGTGGQQINLAAGTYTIEVSDKGDSAARARWDLQKMDSLQEWGGVDGIGQGAALELRLIAPNVLSHPATAAPLETIAPGVRSDVSTLATPMPLPSSEGTEAASTRISTSSSAIVAAVPGGPDSAAWTSPVSSQVASVGASDFVGRPNPLADHVSAVGTGGLALASSEWLPRGISYRGAVAQRPGTRLGPTSTSIGVPASVVEARAPRSGAQVADRATIPAFDGSSTDLGPDWLGRLGDWLARQLRPSADSIPEMVVAGSGSGVQADEPGAEPKPETVVLAGLTSPMAAGLIATLAMEYRRRFRRRAGRRQDPRASARTRPPARPHQGGRRRAGSAVRFASVITSHLFGAGEPSSFAEMDFRPRSDFDPGDWTSDRS